MKIYTTYFGNLKNLPPDIIPISIAANPPKGWKGLEYKKLAPIWTIREEYHKTKDWTKFIENYYYVILSNLDKETTRQELIGMVPGGKDIALVCYEKPENNCHRQIVAAWLNIKEWENEMYSSGQA